MTDEREKIQPGNQKDAEKHSLWERFIKDITPIDRSDVLPPNSILKNERKELKPERPPAEKADLCTPQYEPRKKSREVDGSTHKRLRQGKIPIEARLDLHGMTQIQAYDSLMMFIQRCYEREMRCVLVITGKGGARTSEPGVERGEGVLRQRVPQWLNEVKMHPYVLKTQPSRPKDGGDGALYVLLRRRR